MIIYRPSYGYNEKGCPFSEKLRAFYLHMCNNSPFVAECIVSISYEKCVHYIKIWPDKDLSDMFTVDEISKIVIQESKLCKMYYVQVEIMEDRFITHS
jgi:hypothetical protein